MRTRAEPRATIKDIARETGVTGASVSRVLNDPQFGSVETRKRVLEAVRRLGYSPNHAARGLVRQASMIIGLCINDIENPFCAAFARGIEDAANRHGYTVALCNTDENPLKELAYVHTLLGWQVAGLILSATHSAGPDLVQLVQGVPTVLLDRELPGCKLDIVTGTNREGAAVATRHLLEHGYRTIGTILEPLSLTMSLERLAGYQLALEEAGIAFDPGLVEVAGQTHGGVHSAVQLLRRRPDVQAIFAGNDVLALDVMEAAELVGRSIPADLALIGYDDTKYAALTKLTSVAQPVYEFGQVAMDRLIKRIADPSRPQESVRLNTKLVTRQSCGCMPGGHSLATQEGLR